MPIPSPDIPAAPLVTVADFCGRLGIPVPTDGTAAFISTQAALQDASDLLRDAIGQPLNPQTSTLLVEVNDFGFALIPVSPVSAVLTVVDPNGVTLPGDGSAYQAVGQRLNIYRTYFTYNPHADLPPLFRVTVNHGWDPMPGEILRWVRMLAGAQLAAAAMGNLGMNGGVGSVAIDDGKVAFTTGPAVSIPAEHRERLRATYGGEQR
jgi:hypothetical protein